MTNELEALNQIRENLGTRMRSLTGARCEIDHLYRLTGGANMETWSFAFNGNQFILRRTTSIVFGRMRNYSCHVEARLVECARRSGVKAPEVILELEDADGLGDGYVMRRVDGTSDPRIILETAGEALLRELAIALAAIHAIRPTCITGLQTHTIQEVINGLKVQFFDYGADRPIIALGLQWLDEHLIPDGETTLLHGDFRMGNIMVSEGKLAAVLDWEMAHAGDPHDDLAYGCMTAWRFGRPERVAFGLGSLEDWLSTYESVSGRKVDRGRFRFWLVLRTIWWALGCIKMTTYWRNSVDRSLERAVIGRRAVENELDLLMLLEADAPLAERQSHIVERERIAAAVESSRGEPSVPELIRAVEEWLENEIKPSAQGRRRFEASVAINALRIVQRNMARPIGRGDDALLCDNLRLGLVSLRSKGLLKRLRQQVFEKATNDSPKYPGLALARAKWVRASRDC